MRINVKVWLWTFVVMSLLLTIITLSLVYIFTNHTIVIPNPKYAFYSRREENAKFNPLEDLESLGYLRTDVDKLDWDILWTHEYPFNTLKDILENMKANQKVNHWPGNAAIVNKVDLSTSNDFSFIPKSFKIPRDLKDFESYSASNSQLKFLQKNIFHRNVSIVDEFDKESENLFIQQFVQNPYLIDGYKFDIGVFALVTSVNPLRLYIFDDIFLRFCQSKYSENNFSDKDSYVVRNKFLKPNEIPSLEELSKTHTQKQTLDSYLRTQKKDPKFIWDQVENSIREVFLSREHKIINSLESKNLENYFEVYKFDFLLTNENSKIWMMEANMSPIFAPKDLVGNLLDLIQWQVGVEVNTDPYDPLICKENKCDSKDNCSEKCQLCSECLEGRRQTAVKSAYKENQNSPRRFKRIFPKPISQDFNLEKELSSLESEMNKFMTRWYFEKCRSESKWCQ